MIRVGFKLSETGRKADILAGGTGAEEQTITVPRDHPCFPALVALASMDSKGPYISSWELKGCDAIPTPESALARLEADKAKREADRAADLAQYRERALAALAARTTRTDQGYTHSSNALVARDDETGVEVRLGRETIMPHWPYNAPEDVTTSPEALAWIAELEAQTEARNAELQAEANRLLIERVAQHHATKAQAAQAAEDEAARREALGMVEGDDDYEIEDGALTQVPMWQTHKRGRNWFAAIASDPKSPGGLARTFAEKAKGASYYIVPDLAPGIPVEFGADYYSARGNPDRERWYGYVKSLDDQRLILHKCATAKQAITEGAAYAASLASVR